MKAQNIPFALIYCRLAIGPLMIALSFTYGKAYNFAIFALVLIGLLTDIFDGIIARKLGTSSQKLRVTDSKVDVVFWICTGVSAYLLWPLAIMHKILLIFLLFALEGMCYGTSVLKFKKSTCTHTFIAKLFGVLLFLALADVILFGETRWLFGLCVSIGVVADIEVILITLTLKEWAHDIPSLYHAVKISQGKEIKRHKMFNG